MNFGRIVYHPEVFEAIQSLGTQTRDAIIETLCESVEGNVCGHFLSTERVRNASEVAPGFVLLHVPLGQVATLCVLVGCVDGARVLMQSFAVNEMIHILTRKEVRMGKMRLLEVRAAANSGFAELGYVEEFSYQMPNQMAGQLSTGSSASVALSRVSN